MSFFDNAKLYRRALNPFSKKSGVKHYLAPYCPTGFNEMDDILVEEQIKESIKRDVFFSDRIASTFSILYGDHYDEDRNGRGRKGALDYFIFPLLSRKLLSDIYSYERRGHIYTSVLNLFSRCIAVPLEVVRFSLSLAITLVLFPIVLLIHASIAIQNIFQNALTNYQAMKDEDELRPGVSLF